MKTNLFVFVFMLAGCLKQPASFSADLVQQERRDACREVMLEYCLYNEKCTGQPYDYCFTTVRENKICDQEITSTAEDIKICQKDLQSAACGETTISCMTLE